MADYYNISISEDVLKVGFADPAQNDLICRDAAKKLSEMVKKGTLSGGFLIKINGPASLPVAVVIAHAVAHLYEVVAVFDPKLGKYVVSVSHTPDFKVGGLID